MAYLNALGKLIVRFREGELTLDEFAKEAAAGFVWVKPVQYPEDQGNERTISGVSSVTISNAVWKGTLTRDEAQAIYDALPPAPT